VARAAGVEQDQATGDDILAINDERKHGLPMPRV